MADDVEILTTEQKQFLALISKESTLGKRIYFTGGTPLAAFYLHHRLSEDIDLFSETEFSERSLAPLITKAQRKLGITDVAYDIFLGLHTFQLTFPNKSILKKERPFKIHDLIKQAKAKFDWHIDRIHIGTRLAAASSATDFPRMLKPIDHQEWKDFFVAEAAKLKDEIFE